MDNTRFYLTLFLSDIYVPNCLCWVMDNIGLFCVDNNQEKVENHCTKCSFPVPMLTSDIMNCTQEEKAVFAQVM